MMPDGREDLPRSAKPFLPESQTTWKVLYTPNRKRQGAILEMTNRGSRCMGDPQFWIFDTLSTVKEFADYHGSNHRHQIRNDSRCQRMPDALDLYGPKVDGDHIEGGLRRSLDG